MVPVAKFLENCGKCWTKRPQEESRKLLTQILRPGLQEISTTSTIIKLFGTYDVPVSVHNNLHTLSHLSQNNCVGIDTNFLILQVTHLRLCEAHWQSCKD